MAFSIRARCCAHEQKASSHACFALSLAACGGKNSAVVEKQAPAPQPADGSPRIATSADGVRIQYRVYGMGEPAVILVHGWSCDSNYWSAQLPALKERYTTV